MLWYQIVFLAVIQGLTEFLPISSSAHLILPSQLLNWPDQGLAFDVAVHVGTLIAIVGYFRKDIAQIIFAWCVSIKDKQSTPNSRLAWWICLATLPACVFGLLFDDFISTHLRSLEVIAYTTIGFGVLLWLSDRYGTSHKTEQDLALKSVLLIGLAQALALIPGTSRSGITMTAARFLGFGRESAARFSFLLSIPLILAAGGLKSVELVSSNLAVDWGSILMGVILSAISAYLCIYLFLKWLNTIGFFPFFVYRLILGGVLLLIVYL
ncbi:undecaprenyl-diphosphate phosphatase [Marinomonas sp. M1K-6]|uniref:Undecaprenyl-diphosphatase n=1 Tax=Marinomonas profundi TaxID=2726122 RepID=A0A847QXA6_9GAMM|nr:undecaprenyl-diphosphate phosphatase [Marinomonas profundi]NLQ18228.1 undecaprenyl-diphosphate phosphatase [Marinomonas profundi]UDV03580.1 undecaprenyl-diphosphate phosphatase [Marinomonas profundi]